MVLWTNVRYWSRAHDAPINLLEEKNLIRRQRRIAFRRSAMTRPSAAAKGFSPSALYGPYRSLTKGIGMDKGSNGFSHAPRSGRRRAVLGLASGPLSRGCFGRIFLEGDPGDLRKRADRSWKAFSLNGVEGKGAPRIRPGCRAAPEKDHWRVEADSSRNRPLRIFGEYGFVHRGETNMTQEISMSGGLHRNQHGMLIC